MKQGLHEMYRNVNNIVFMSETECILLLTKKSVYTECIEITDVMKPLGWGLKNKSFLFWKCNFQIARAAICIIVLQCIMNNVDTIKVKSRKILSNNMEFVNCCNISTTNN